MKYRLPIGTLITLKNIKYPVLLVGHEMTISETQQEYDYIGVLYPVGFSPDVDMIFFNHTDIIDIVQLGYADVEHSVYADMLDMEKKEGIYSDTNVNINDIGDEENIEDFMEL